MVLICKFCGSFSCVFHSAHLYWNIEAFHQYFIIICNAMCVHWTVTVGPYFCSSLGDGLVFPVRAQHQPSSYNSMGSTQTRSDSFLLCLMGSSFSMHNGLTAFSACSVCMKCLLHFIDTVLLKHYTSIQYARCL